MPRLLIVGDVHATVEDLADCVRLREFVLSQVKAYSPDKVVFLGDLYHSHAIKNVEVEQFWAETFRLLAPTPVIVLVGNHDRPGNAASTAHSLQTHSDVLVVSSPVVVGNDLFLPYYHDHNRLVAEAQSYPTTDRVFCHAAFSGGHYDNGQPIKTDGYYGRDVVDPDDLPQRSIVSGHIHKTERFGKVWYPGSPRWQTMSDANSSRAIYLLDDAVCQALSTDRVLRRTWHLVMTPNDLCQKELGIVGDWDKVLVDIDGPSSFCEAQKTILVEKGYRVRVFATDRKTATVSESAGIEQALGGHLERYSPRFGSSLELLRLEIRKRLGYV